MSRSVLTYLFDYPVKLEASNNKYIITPINFSVFGHLHSFKIGDSEQEEFYYVVAEISNDKVYKGYCRKDIYEDFRNNHIKDISDTSYWFNKSFEKANIGDIFEISKIDNLNESGTIDYEKYYFKTVYKFKIKTFDINYNNSFEYPNPLNPINDEASPDYFFKEIVLKNLDNKPSGKFYKINFYDRINEIPTNIRDKYWERIMLICSMTNAVVRDGILEVIAINHFDYLSSVVDSKYNNDDSTDYNNLPLIDMMVVEILKNWGYFHQLNIPPSLLFDTLDLDVLSDYLSSLITLYRKLYCVNENILFPKDDSQFPINEFRTRLTNDPNKINEKESERRIIKLLGILPSEVISLFPVYHRLAILDVYLMMRDVREDRPELREYIATNRGTLSLYRGENTTIIVERELINLVESFKNSYDEANVLFDFLLENGEYSGKKTTKFNRLYDTLDDVTTISGVTVDSENNRMRLALVLYEIWRNSKYSFFSVPPSGLNEEGINPLCYFKNEGSEFYNIIEDANGNLVSGSYPIIEFSPIERSYGYKEGYDFKPEQLIENNIISVYKYVYSVSRSVSQKENGEVLYQEKTKELFSRYHLYQTISLVGYEIDEDLVQNAPNIQLDNIPAFLFYYYYDYDRIKNIQAAVSLAFEVTLEVGLFFLTSGTSTLTNLKYLKHVTKLKFITKGENAYQVSEAALLAWKGIDASSQTISMTSSIIYSLLNYQGTVTDDPLLRKIANFFMFFSIGSLGTSIYSQRRIIKMADEILQDIPIGHPLEGSRDFFTQIIQRQNTLIQIVQDLINNLPSSITNERKLIISNFFNNLPNNELKTAFHFDFKNLAPEKWDSFTVDVLDNWKTLRINNVLEAKDLTVITKQSRVSSINKYYENILLRTELEKLTYAKRWNFLDEMGNISPANFQKFVTDETLINKWLRYYDDVVLRAEFKTLGESDIIKWCERYGDISDEAFSLIKYDTKGHFKHLMDFPDATHNIAYFNKRRAEMLPPPFKDFGGSGKLYGIQEIDSFIELELLSGGKARPSLANEAGDIIMEGGSLNGLSLDPLGPTHKMANIISSKPNPNQFFTDIWLGNMTDKEGFLGSIQTHFEKIYVPKPNKPPLNKVVIDYKYFQEISVSIGENPNYFKDYIDNIIITHFSEYNNANYLIKLNY